MLEFIIAIGLLILGVFFVLLVFQLICKFIGFIWWGIIGAAMLFMIAYGFHLI